MARPLLTHGAAQGGRWGASGNRQTGVGTHCLPGAWPWQPSRAGVRVSLGQRRWVVGAVGAGAGCTPSPCSAGVSLPGYSPTAPGAARLTPASRLGYPQLLPSHLSCGPRPRSFTLNPDLPGALSLGRPESTPRRHSAGREAVCLPTRKVQLKQTNREIGVGGEVEEKGGPCASGWAWRVEQPGEC